MSATTTNTAISRKKRERSYIPGNPRLYCTFPHCTKSFARMEHLRRHQATHEGNKSFICTTCGLSFTRKDTLIRHNRRQHSEVVSNLTDEMFKEPIYLPYKSETEESLATDFQTPAFNEPDLLLSEPNDIHFWDSNQASSHLANQDILDWLFRPIEEPLIGSDDSQRVGAISPHFQLESTPPAYNCTTDTVNSMKNAIIMNNDDTYLLESITPQFINWAVDEYWELHSRWPILHKPTFNINKCPPILLWSMTTLSMFLKGNEDSISLAVKVHQTLRHSVYMMAEFQSPTVWIFQALLLAEIFELLASTEEQHNMASRFHAVLISTMRKAGPMDEEDDSSLDDNWKQFIGQEKKRRIAFFAFVLDTQHCAFFNQPAAMFLSDMHIHLPCDESIWEAPNAENWNKLYSDHSRPPLFTTAVGAFLKGDQRALSGMSLTPWSSMILLHGLMSAGWSMKLRGKTSMEKKSNSEEIDWSTAIIKSYNGWLRHYQKNFIDNGKLAVHHPYVLGCLTTYQIAHVLVNCPVDSFEAFIFQLANQRWPGSEISFIGDWIRTSTVQDDLTHALDLMEMYLLDGQNYDISKETALHRPWCLYLASITLWTYDYFCGDDDRSGNSRSFKQCVSDLRSEIMKTSAKKKSSRFLQRSKRSNDKTIVSCQANELLKHVNDLLELSRWGVLQKRIKVTRSLLKLVG